MNKKSLIGSLLLILATACSRPAVPTQPAAVDTTAAPTAATQIPSTTPTIASIPATPTPAALVQTFRGHTAWIESVAFSPDGKYVLTGSMDHTARLWDVITGQTVQIFKGRAVEVYSVAFSLNGQ